MKRKGLPEASVPNFEARDNGQPPAGDALDSPSGANTADKPADALADFAPAEPPAPKGIPDPETELAAFKSPVRAEGKAKPPARVSTLQIRKPNDQEYVRVKPGEERVLPLFKVKNGDKLYLFKPEVEPFLNPRHIRPYRLVLAKSLRALVPFVWALPVPQDDLGRTWHESADAAARDAEHQWVKIVADMIGGVYVAYPAGGTLPEPEWPAETFVELVLLAFRNQRLDSPDHPIIKQLNGEVVP
jgi:hypothetical protein